MTIDPVTAAQNTEYFSNKIKKSLDAGKVSEEKKEARIKEIFEEQKKKVQSIYPARKKVIEYKEEGKYVDISV